MVLFKLRMWSGQLLIALAVYPLRGRETLFIWWRNQHAVAIGLPIVARRGW